MARPCSICIVQKGLKGGEMVEDSDYIEHLERDHHIPVRRDNETEEQCFDRFRKQYPESFDSRTCKCPGCIRLRKS